MKTANIMVIGSINMDLVTEVPHMPLPGETLKSMGFHMIPGGKGMNQAVAAARMGSAVTFVGKVGYDMYGNELLQRFESEGIDRTWVHTDPDVSTGLAFINVTEAGENAIVLHPGANGQVHKSDIDSVVDAMREVDLVLLQLEIPQTVVEYTLRLCKRIGVPVLLNPAPAAHLSPDVLQGLPYLVLNEIEGEQLTGVSSDEPDKIVAALHDLGVENVVLTLGGNGVYYSENGVGDHLTAKSVEVVDTTAAGDTFVGTFSVFLSEGCGFEEAVRKGIDAASITVTKMGAQSSIPRRVDL